jgi:cell filamentation protein
LINLEPKLFADRLAHYLSEINAIHPFREGNGRVQRLFISQLAEQAGYTLDYSSLNQTKVYPVMQASFIGNEQPLAELILKIISW